MILNGGPDLGQGSVRELSERFARDHGDFRRATVDEPRGSEVLVGALLVPPRAADCAAGVIFFNTVGTLGMCGHGMMGLARTLAHLGRIQCGTHRIETPVGVVAFTLSDDGSIAVANVASRRTTKDVRVELQANDAVCGDVAWGGNWFFITADTGQHPLDRAHADRLTSRAWLIRRELARAGITGDDGSPIDHIEFTGPSQRSDCAWRSFVLCPGGAYDRSPCGTGTSAKLACLAADGKVAAGVRVGAESFVGTRFEAWYQRGADGAVLPTVAGRAWITAEVCLLLEASDPCAAGIPR